MFKVVGEVFQPSGKKTATHFLHKFTWMALQVLWGSFLPNSSLHKIRPLLLIVCAILAPKVLNQHCLCCINKEGNLLTALKSLQPMVQSVNHTIHWNVKLQVPRLPFIWNGSIYPLGMKWEITQIWNNLVFQFDYVDHLMHIWEYEQRYIYAPWDILIYMHTSTLIQRGSSFWWNDVHAHKVCQMYENVEVCAYM